MVSLKSGYVSIDDYQVHYFKYGDKGPRIVLLHGLWHIAQALNFRQFLEDMSDSYQILAFDLLGHGRSSDPTSPIGFEEHARIIHQTASELGFEKYNLIGYSFGGWISMRLAALYGESVEKLVIVDITPRTYDVPEQVEMESGIPFEFDDSKSAVDWLSGLNPADDDGDFWINFIDNVLIEEEGVWRVSSHPSRKTQLYKDGDGWDFIKRIKAPCLLFRGSLSDYAVVVDVTKMERLMEDLVVVSVEGADHNVPISHGAEFEEAIRDFIQA